MDLQNVLNNTEEYTYVIAEIAQTHDGSLGQAHAFIDAVATTGADAIKFQTHIAEEESTTDEPFRVPFSYEDKTRYDYWRRMEFTEEQWNGLYIHAREKGLDFLSSVFSIKALKMLEKIGIPAWKFGSGEVFNEILMEKALETKKPLILSTGMSVFEDIDKQIKLINKYGNEFVLMQCTTSYPCKAEDIGLNMLAEFKRRYGCYVGLSDHSSTIYPSLSAAVLGAKMVEVHVTMSEYMFGPDVSSSITIDDLKKMVEGIRFINDMNNNPCGKIELSEDLRNLKKIFSKGVYTSKKLHQGDLLTEDVISIKKPCSGIAASDYKNILNKSINKNIEKGQAIMWEDLKDV